MAIAFQQNGGGDSSDRTPVVKYNAKAGRIYRIDRSNDSGEWTTDENEITNEFSAVFDMENIEVGWMLFASGIAPNFAMVKLGQNPGSPPSARHKEGFRVLVKLSKACGGDVRELTSSANAVKQSISDLHDMYLAGVAENPGKLPVVKLTKTIPITTTFQTPEGAQKQTNYAPVWAITGWVDRPTDLVFAPKNAPKQVASPATQATPPSTGSTRVDPPAAKQPEMAGADEDFG